MYTYMYYMLYQWNRIQEFIILDLLSSFLIVHTGVRHSPFYYLLLVVVITISHPSHGPVPFGYNKKLLMKLPRVLIL